MRRRRSTSASSGAWYEKERIALLSVVAMGESPCADVGPVRASPAAAKLPVSALTALAAAEMARKLRRVATEGVRMIALPGAQLTLVTGIGEPTCDRGTARMPGLWRQRSSS